MFKVSENQICKYTGILSEIQVLTVLKVESETGIKSKM